MLLSLKEKENSDIGYNIMNLEDITPSEIRQSQKDKYCLTPLLWGTRVVKFTETGSGMVGARHREEGEMAKSNCCLMDPEFQFTNEKILGIGCTTT